MILFGPGPKQEHNGTRPYEPKPYRVESYPGVACTPEVKLPRGWVRCPACGLHYVLKGKAHPVLCSMVRDI